MLVTWGRKIVASAAAGTVAASVIVWAAGASISVPSLFMTNFQPGLRVNVRRLVGGEFTSPLITSGTRVTTAGMESSQGLGQVQVTEAGMHSAQQLSNAQVSSVGYHSAQGLGQVRVTQIGLEIAYLSGVGLPPPSVPPSESCPLDDFPVASGSDRSCTD